MSDEFTPFETPSCSDCQQTETSDPQPVTRRDIIRKHGLRGLVMVIAGMGALKVGTAKAGYMYMGRYRVDDQCVSACQKRYHMCDMYRNEFGQVYYTNCGMWTYYNANCCAYYGFGPSCCTN